MLGALGLIGLVAWLAWCVLHDVDSLARSRAAGSARCAVSRRRLLCAWVVFQINGLTQVNFWEGKVQHQMMWMVAWSLALGRAEDGGCSVERAAPLVVIDARNDSSPVPHGFARYVERSDRGPRARRATLRPRRYSVHRFFSSVAGRRADDALLGDFETSRATSPVS